MEHSPNDLESLLSQLQAAAPYATHPVVRVPWNDMVTIKGKREKEDEITTSDYYYQECYWGAFSRSVILPVDVEAEKAEASMKNGILTIRLPKIEKIKTRKIKVATN